ncbi:MAG: hypothetical protein ABIL52_00435 [candidate division WOR-3 bacterium]
MCHLSIEKALKGIYSKKFNEEPKKIGLKIPSQYKYNYTISR